MSWPQWQGAMQPGVGAVPTAAVLNPAPTVINPSGTMPVGMQYTPEQWQQMQQQNWQQWAQWQQQYQQWQQQYGAQYEKTLSAMTNPPAAASSMPVSMTAAPPPLPQEPKPPLPPEEPPVSMPNYPQPCYRATASTSNQQFWKNQPPPNIQHEFNAKRDYPDPKGKISIDYDDSKMRNDYQEKRQQQDTHVTNRTDYQDPNISVGIKRQSQNEFQDPKRNKVENTTSNSEELSEGEKKFMKQFAEWEAQFNKWKEQNQDHPDKTQYKEYEKKWEAWRNQLLERREQMRRRRLGLPVQGGDSKGRMPSINLNKPPPNIIPLGSTSVNPSGVMNIQQGHSTNVANSGITTSNITSVNKPVSNSSIIPASPHSSTTLTSKPPPIHFTSAITPLYSLSEDEAADSFLKSSTSSGGGIPGLDLVDAPSKADSPQPEEIVTDKLKNEKSVAPDLEALSKNINSILGDTKLLSMLGLVTQNQTPNTAEQMKKVQSVPVASSEQGSVVMDDMSRSSFNQDVDSRSQHWSGDHYNEEGQLDGCGEFGNRRDFSRENEFSVRGGGEFNNRGNFGNGRNGTGFGRGRESREIGNCGSDDYNTDKFNRPPPGCNFEQTGETRPDFGINKDVNKGFGGEYGKFNDYENDSYGSGGDFSNRVGPSGGFGNQRGIQMEDFANGGGSNEIDNNRGVRENFDKISSGTFGNRPGSCGDLVFNRRPPPTDFESNRGGPIAHFGNNRGSSLDFPNNRNGPPGDFGSNIGRPGDFGTMRVGPGDINNRRGQGNDIGPGGDFNNRGRVGDNFSNNRFGPGYDHMETDTSFQGDNRFNSRKNDFDGNRGCDFSNDFSRRPLDNSYNEYRKRNDYDYNESYEQTCDFKSSGTKWENESKDFEDDTPNICNDTIGEEEFLKIVKVIDYDHKSIKTAITEVTIVPPHLFDYRHKPVNRIPLPERPKWLKDAFKLYPEFEPAIGRPNYNMRYTSLVVDRSNYCPAPVYNRYGDTPTYNRRPAPGPPEDSRRRRIYDDRSKERKVRDTESRRNEDYLGDGRRGDFENNRRREGDTLKKTQSTISMDDILNQPGRFKRPSRIVIILRGPPGSGKTFLAKLIKDKEVENGGSAPRILSLDDYFMVEQEKESLEDGKKVMIKEMVYEYEECMENSYRTSLLKSFKKTITDGYFSFIIVDNVNDKTKYFSEMWSFAKENGFEVYICQLELDAQVCSKRNVHNRTEKEIENIVFGWESTPTHYTLLDATNLIQAGSIPEVEMEEINSPNDNFDDEEEENEEHACRSKWDNFECSINNLAKLDGISKPLRPASTMEDYLQLDEWREPESQPGKKRVRWADLEERREQEKMRAIGFVVGQTDWSRMMDPTQGGSALTRTKYIERVRNK